MLLRVARQLSYLLLVIIALSWLPVAPILAVSSPALQPSSSNSSTQHDLLSTAPLPVAPAAVSDVTLPSLSMDIAVAPDPIAVGETGVFTLTVHNDTQIAALGVVVTVPTPNGTLAEAGSGVVVPTTGWQWTLARLAAKDSTTFNGSFRVVRQPKGDAVVFTATATAPTLVQSVQAQGGAVVTSRTPSRSHFNPGTDSILTSADGRVRVRFPAKTFARGLALSYRNLAEALVDIPSRTRPQLLANGRRIVLPFVLNATDDAGTEIHQFDAPIELTVRYTPEVLQAIGLPVADLSLFWFDEDAQQWLPIPTTNDPDAQTLTATVDHFSSFTIGDGLSPSTAFIPTLQGFQGSAFTGAASYSYPIEVPAGPGGLTPSVRLSYSSGASDGTSGERAKWQAGWTGKGWSLDAGGYVALNKSGVGDGWNNFSLVFGGQSFDIIKGAPLSGYTVSDPALDHWSWHAVDDQFTKIAPEFNGNVTVGTAPNTATYATYIWHAWTKDGNRYDFGLNNGMLWWTNDLDTREVYKWLLIKETDTHGNKILYDYQVDSVDKALHNVVAPYHYDYHLKLYFLGV